MLRIVPICSKITETRAELRLLSSLPHFILRVLSGFQPQGYRRHFHFSDEKTETYKGAQDPSDGKWQFWDLVLGLYFQTASALNKDTILAHKLTHGSAVLTSTGTQWAFSKCNPVTVSPPSPCLGLVRASPGSARP